MGGGGTDAGGRREAGGGGIVAGLRASCTIDVMDLDGMKFVTSSSLKSSAAPGRALAGGGRRCEDAGPAFACFSFVAARSSRSSFVKTSPSSPARPGRFVKGSMILRRERPFTLAKRKPGREPSIRKYHDAN
jgi:hypothetical protein